MEPADWQDRINVMALVKQRLAQVDAEGLWEYHLPRAAASEERVREVEAHLGQALDLSYRAFLRHADGWLAFYQTVDLFGSAELLGGERFQHAQEMLGYLQEEQPAASGPSDLLPIAASPVDLDLFVMTPHSSSRPATVIWLAGSEIDRYPSFDEYFLAMIDYNRNEIQNLQGPSG
jgi:hypothetical protein